MKNKRIVVIIATALILVIAAVLIASVGLDINHYIKHQFIKRISVDHNVNKWSWYENISQKRIIERNNKMPLSREEILETHFSFKELLLLISKYPKHKKAYINSIKQVTNLQKNATTQLVGIFIENNRLVIVLYSDRVNFEETFVTLNQKKYYCKKNNNLSLEQQNLIEHYKEYIKSNLSFFELPINKMINVVLELKSSSGSGIPISWANGINYNALELRNIGLYSRIDEFGKLLIQDKKTYIKGVYESKLYTKKDKRLFRKLVNNRRHNITLMAENYNAGDNTFQVFKEALKNNNKNVYYVASNKIYNDEKDNTLKRNMVIHNSKKHHKLVSLSDKWVGSYSLNLELLPTTSVYKDIHMNFIPGRWIFIPHGIAVGDKNVSMLSHYNWGNPYETYANSPVERDTFAEIYGFKNVLSLGSPRMDKWAGDIDYSRTILFFFTWRMGLSNYARQNKVSIEESSYVSIAISVVKKITELKPDYNIYYVIHHEVERGGVDSIIKKALAGYDVNYIYFSERDGIDTFNKVFKKAEYLITDFSSVAYDFAYKKGSKIIYYLQKEFIEHHYPLQEKFFELQMGRVVTSLDELQLEMSVDIKDRTISQRRKNFFYKNDNNNAHRVYNAIFKGEIPQNTQICNEIRDFRQRVFGNKRRLNIFFFYDADGIVDEYVFYYLEKLIPNCDENCVVVNGKIRNRFKQRLNAMVDRVIVRKNEGFDSWAFKEAIESYGYRTIANEYDEVLLNNFTNFGPFYPFEEMFSEMDSRECDIWGHCRYIPMENQRKNGVLIPEHLMSYFIVFRQSVTKSKDFVNYWKTIKKPYSYDEAIFVHEFRCTQYFERLGYITDSFIKEYSYPKEYMNLPVYMAYPLLKNDRSPIIKRKAFFIEDGEFRFPLFSKESVYDLIDYIKKETDYDVGLILDNIKRTQQIEEDTSLEVLKQIEDNVNILKNKKSNEIRINRENNRIYSHRKLFRNHIT